MNSLKAAAVVAGSMVIVGVAAPAFANDASDFTATSLNGGLDTITSRASQEQLDVQPLHTDMLDTENKNSLVGTAQDALDNANAVGLPGGLLGGLPLQK
jgi:hypothetical protein